MVEAGRRRGTGGLVSRSKAPQGGRGLSGGQRRGDDASLVIVRPLIGLIDVLLYLYHITVLFLTLLLLLLLFTSPSPPPVRPIRDCDLY